MKTVKLHLVMKVIRHILIPVLSICCSDQVSGANELIVEEYLKDAHTPEDIRNEFTEALGDLFMVIPVIKVAGYHRGKSIQKAYTSAAQQTVHFKFYHLRF